MFGIIFGLAYALEPLLVDLKILSGAALAGEIINAIFFESRIKRLRRLWEAGRSRRDKRTSARKNSRKNSEW